MEKPLGKRQNFPTLFLLLGAGRTLYQIHLHCKELIRYTSCPMITKRQLGIFIIIASLLSIAGIFAIEWFGAGNFQGIGPVQKVALGLSTISGLIGLSLLPLGDRPA
jgi:hypothetical protein